MTARSVVVSTGFFHKPNVPACTSGLSSDVVQLDPYSYKNPSDCPDGATLIVGSSMSGIQICEDFIEAGREVYLAVGIGHRVPRVYRGRDAFSWMVDMGWLTKPINPVTHEERYAASMMLTGARDRHGVNLHQLAARGVKLAGRLNAVEDGVAHFADDLNQRIDESDAFAAEFKNTVDGFVREQGLDVPEAGPDNTDEGSPCDGPRYPETDRIDMRDAGIASVIWATGFSCDYGWIREPVLDARGFPQQRRGVSDLPGLYFCGQHWLYTFASGGFYGVGEDPAYLAEHIRLRAETAA
jgi:putative flavoprotein involved in K+ transport